MRRGIDTLTQYITDHLHQPWQGEAAFVFCNKARSRIKVLRWDKHGVWLCLRRLHQGHFIWPRQGDVAWLLSPEQADWLMAEAFCLYAERERFKPYEKAHTTVKDACEIGARLAAANLLLYHTEDRNLAQRKALYTAEGAPFFRWQPAGAG